jgi:dihydropteroate synthase
MQILSSACPGEINKIMQEIGVDPYGARIMLPKSSQFLVRLKSVNNIAANIIKQEMLSLGADAAIARGALTGKTKNTDILLIGRRDQLDTLIAKLKLQPFGLQKLALEIDGNIKNFTKDNFTLVLKNKSLSLSGRTRIMGIINLTPDSFSSDGLLQYPGINYPQAALTKAQQLVVDGADFIDLGGESSRPGAKKVSVKEELSRTVPVVKLLAKKIKVPISIDTVKPEVAKAALDNGAQIINDIGGLRDKRMIEVASRYKAAVVIMHMRGNPASMQRKIIYKSLINDISDYLRTAIDCAQQGGISRDKIIIDPGVGFGKTPAHNLEIIKRLSQFKSLGQPILIGPSRKSFIAKVLQDDAQPRLSGTLAACVIAAQAGANIVRVYDVKAVSQSLKILQAVENANA